MNSAFRCSMDCLWQNVSVKDSEIFEQLSIGSREIKWTIKRALSGHAMPSVIIIFENDNTDYWHDPISHWHMLIVHNWNSYAFYQVQPFRAVRCCTFYETKFSILRPEIHGWGPFSFIFKFFISYILHHEDVSVQASFLSAFLANCNSVYCAMHIVL